VYTQEICIFPEKNQVTCIFPDSLRNFVYLLKMSGNIHKSYFLKFGSDFYTDLLTGNFFHECICEYGENCLRPKLFKQLRVLLFLGIFQCCYCDFF